MDVSQLPLTVNTIVPFAPIDPKSPKPVFAPITPVAPLLLHSNSPSPPFVESNFKISATPWRGIVETYVRPETKKLINPISGADPERTGRCAIAVVATDGTNFSRPAGAHAAADRRRLRHPVHQVLREKIYNIDAIEPDE